MFPENIKIHTRSILSSYVDGRVSFKSAILNSLFQRFKILNRKDKLKEFYSVYHLVDRLFALPKCFLERG